jgi:hypothetical protein
MKKNVIAGLSMLVLYGSVAMAEVPSGRFVCDLSGTGRCGEICLGSGVVGGQHVHLRLDTRDGLVSLNGLTGRMSAEIDDHGTRTLVWDWDLIRYPRLSLSQYQWLVTATLASGDKDGRILEFTCRPSRRGPDKR